MVLVSYEHKNKSWVYPKYWHPNANPLTRMFVLLRELPGPKYKPGVVHTISAKPEDAFVSWADKTFRKEAYAIEHSKGNNGVGRDIAQCFFHSSENKIGPKCGYKDCPALMRWDQKHDEWYCGACSAITEPLEHVLNMLPDHFFWLDPMLESPLNEDVYDEAYGEDFTAKYNPTPDHQYKDDDSDFSRQFGWMNQLRNAEIANPDKKAYRKSADRGTSEWKLNIKRPGSPERRILILESPGYSEWRHKIAEIERVYQLNKLNALGDRGKDWLRIIKKVEVSGHVYGQWNVRPGQIENDKLDLDLWVQQKLIERIYERRWHNISQEYSGLELLAKIPSTYRFTPGVRWRIVLRAPIATEIEDLRLPEALKERIGLVGNTAKLREIVDRALCRSLKKKSVA